MQLILIRGIYIRAEIPQVLSAFCPVFEPRLLSKIARGLLNFDQNGTTWTNKLFVIRQLFEAIQLSPPTIQTAFTQDLPIFPSGPE